jgi:hypothetical protein
MYRAMVSRRSDAALAVPPYGFRVLQLPCLEEEMNLTARIDALLLFFEKRVGRACSAILVATVLLVLAHVYVAPAPGPVNHGNDFNQMSFDPFDFTPGFKVHNRILTSFVAHYAYKLPFFPYRDFILVINIVGVCFISLLYGAARREGLSPTSSLLAAAVLTFSAPVLFFINYAGYTDITSYALVFLAMCTVRNNLVWPWMLALALLNHENNFFSFPWFLLFYYLRNDRKVYRALGAVGLMVLSAVPWYFWVRYVASFQAPLYGVSYYASLGMVTTLRMVLEYLYVGFFQAFKLFWVIPAYAIVTHLRERNFLEASLYLLIVACACAQLCFAIDTSRLISASFPVVWLGFLTLARRWNVVTFQRMIGHLFLLNLFVPEFYVGHDVLVRFYSRPVSWFLGWYFDMESWRH